MNNRRICNLILSSIIIFQQGTLLNAAQVPQQSWWSNIVSGGIDLIKGGVASGVLYTLVYKAQEYDLQKNAAEDNIKHLQERLQKAETDKEKEEITAEIKKEENIRDQKKTLGQRAANVALALIVGGVIGLHVWAAWDPYLVKTNKMLDKYCGDRCSIRIGNVKIFELIRN